jgi:hypothetical protein
LPNMVSGGFKVFTAVVMKSSIFWDILPCSLVKVNQYFLCGLQFNHEYGGNMFLWNVSWLSSDYMALYCRRQNF